MMSGSQPMPPEQVAEMLEEAEASDRAEEAAQAALEAAAEDARDGDETITDIQDEPSLIDRIVDLLDGDDDEAPEARPAEA
jgi:hypothetical protein